MPLAAAAGTTNRQWLQEQQAVATHDETDQAAVTLVGPPPVATSRHNLAGCNPKPYSHLMPRMLRGFRLHRTMTERSCKGRARQAGYSMLVSHQVQECV